MPFAPPQPVIDPATGQPVLPAGSGGSDWFSKAFSMTPIGFAANAINDGPVEAIKQSAGGQAVGAITDAAGNVIPDSWMDYAKELLGIGIPENVADPSQFQFGQEAFNEGRDQAAFNYMEALDKSNRELTPTTIRDVAPIQTSTIRDINLGPVERISASGPAAVTGFEAARIDETGVGPAATAAFEGVDRAAYDRDLALGLRGDQVSDLQRVRETAEGRGPSAAADEYALALDAITNDQAALVNQAQGDEKVALRNQAMLEGSRRAMQAAHERAALKAREMLGGQQALLSGVQAARGADVEVATTIARLDQEANALEANLRTAIAQGNRDAINALTDRKAQIDAERARAQATLTQGAREFGAAATNTSNLDYAKRLDEANATNAAAANKQTVDEAQFRLQRDTQVGDQSIKAQQITNQQGVDRDVAQGAENRGAFGATTDAQLGALNTANTSIGTGTQATTGLVGANKDSYELALKDKEERDRMEAAERQSKRTMVAGLAQAASDLVPDSLI